MLFDNKPIPSRSNKDWSTRGIKRYVMLMVEFLRISPCYDLARQISDKQLTYDQWETELLKLYESEIGKPLSHDQKVLCVDNFYKVLNTYQEFGDIRTIDFEDWWQNRGINIFAAEHDRPLVRQIYQLEKGQDSDNAIAKRLQTYFVKHRASEGKPPALLLSVPLGVSKKSVLSQISQLIDMANIPLAPKTQQAKKPLAAKRLRALPLYKALSLIWIRTLVPQLNLWQLGVRAKISPVNAIGLDASNKKTYKNTASQRIHMSILTSRMLLKAKLLAENAARGEFPSTKKILLPHFDYNDIKLRILPKMDAMKASQKKTSDQSILSGNTTK